MEPKLSLMFTTNYVYLYRLRVSDCERSAHLVSATWRRIPEGGRSRSTMFRITNRYVSKKSYSEPKKEVRFYHRTLDCRPSWLVQREYAGRQVVHYWWVVDSTKEVLMERWNILSEELEGENWIGGTRFVILQWCTHSSYTDCCFNFAVRRSNATSTFVTTSRKESTTSSSSSSSVNLIDRLPITCRRIASSGASSENCSSKVQTSNK